MDIQQQTKNVAAQGRFGDSMLLHVNPAEVKGLAGAVPLTINPETGQPEAFLPFLAPVLGSMLGGSLLTGATIGGLTLSAGAAAGIGAGLATYAQTGGSGSKALLSGLTAGLGTRALSNVANPNLANEIATSQVASGVGDVVPGAASLVGPSIPGTTTVPTTLASQQAAAQAAGAGGTSAGQSLNTMFSGGFDEGMKSLAGAAMTPSGMAAGTAAGTAGVLASQEEFERQMIQMGLDSEERKRRMYERYPEQIPMASGGRTGFAQGQQTGEDYPIEDIYINDYFGGSDYSDPISRFNPSGGYFGGNTGGYGNFYGGFNSNAYAPIARRTRPIGRGFMPGFMPEQRYFQGDNPAQYLTQYARDITANNPDATPETSGRGRSRGLQPMAPPGGFRDEGGPAYTPPPPMFGGYGNPFMQSPSYQGFYGVPQMQQMFNPYARFTQQPMPYQPYVPYEPPVDTPPDDDGTPPNDGETPPDDGGGTGGGDKPPIDAPPPINDPMPGFGRKGGGANVPPTAPVDDFTNPVVGGPVEPPIDRFKTLPYEPPVSTPPVNTPPPTVTIPIEGGADVTIPDYSRPQPPAVMPPTIEPPMKRPEPPMSIDRIGNYDLDRKFGAVPISEKAPAQQAPAPEPATQSFFDMFPDAPQRPQMGTMDRRFYTDPVTGLMKQGSSTDVGYRNKLKEYLDSNPEASANYYERNPLLSEEEIAERNAASRMPVFNPRALSNLAEGLVGNQASNISSQPAIALPNVPTMPMTSLTPDIQGTLPEPTLNPTTGNMEQPLSEFKPIAPPPIAPPVQSVTTPQPFLQQPKAPQTGGIPVTGGGPLGSGILPEANLPAGTPPSSGPVDPRIGSGIKIPSGPAMGGISSFTPPPSFDQNKPPMSGGIFGAPMFAGGGDTDKKLPNEGLEALAKTEKGRKAVEAMGFQEGGQTDMMQDPITQNVIMFIRGENSDEDAINMFIEKYGDELFLQLRSAVLKQAAGNPDAQTEGLIQGNGNSGMADDLPMNIGKFAEAAVSQDEYIIPADVVSMIGDGSSNAGSKQLDNMLDRVRMNKTGTKTQASPMNPQKVMPA